jgi:hypothetical protein
MKLDAGVLFCFPVLLGRADSILVCCFLVNSGKPVSCPAISGLLRCVIPLRQL